MISIIIPAYNSEKTIVRCFESIFAQTYQDFEVVVVDDGSTDDTAKVVLDFARTINKEYTSSESRTSKASREENQAFLHLVRQENKGAQAARNRGWEECKMENGEWRMVLFCDADIVMREDCLAKMVRALEAHPDASYVYSSFRFGWKKFKLWPFDARRLRQMPYIHTTSLIRVSSLKDVLTSLSDGPFDESVNRLQDWDLWLTMLEQGHIGVWISEVLFRVIHTKGTMSQWLPSLVYKLPQWLGVQTKAVTRYNEAVAAIKAKHRL